MEHLRTLVAIWADRYPPSHPRRHQLIEKIVITPIVFSRLLSFDIVRSSFPNVGRHVFMDVYVLAFSMIVTTILWIPGQLGTIGAVIAAYRIGDIVTYRLYFMLVKSQEQPWDRVLIRRSLVIVSINFYETVAGYAVLYLTVGGIASPALPASPVRKPLIAFYYSLVTATTLGYGDYTPIGSISMVLVMTQLFSSILFLLFLIPALVSLFSTDKI